MAMNIILFLQGGGGFLNRMFGGGGSNAEAADLFIQVNTSSENQETVTGQNELRNTFANNRLDQEDDNMDEVDDEDFIDEHSFCEIECSHNGCDYIASNLLDYENHYSQHSLQCFECGIGFDTAHRLEVHHDERHNPFFEIQVSREPGINHFRCLHPTCEIRFSNNRTRDEHSRIIHFIHGESSRRRKAEDNGVTSILNGAMNKMSLLEGEDTGWSGEMQHGLEMKTKRRVKKAARKMNLAPETHGI